MQNIFYFARKKARELFLQTIRNAAKETKQEKRKEK